ncbi:Deoxyribose-phosphate aldolase [Jeotgalibaca dankookensis]|uniref:Deoxyribose-phosphate aldolase n=1 Tax=Jeotgalibaca dankookensis TaxID=708126 RepID=A0A1S6IRW5_9LACT|nr:deoxyribose-phosphate aldolase [Jeotgalibaca dankookensis]AQS54288.1 Deoxyribose-phosphate aldolase [Jeotgalibaca dankookensis]
MDKLNRYIDHTLLKAGSTEWDINALIDEAIENQFYSVCINPEWVKHAREKIGSQDVKVCTVIGFPLGATTSQVKAFETKNAVENGADEVDMVINIDQLKTGNTDVVFEDIKAVVEASGDALVKVIIETCLLTDDEKKMACQLSKKAGADYVKTSTGFSTDGATPEDVKLMREAVGKEMGVKASGGIHDAEEAREMIKNGATRLGTSRSVEICSN